MPCRYKHSSLLGPFEVSWIGSLFHTGQWRIHISTYKRAPAWTKDNLRFWMSLRMSMSSVGVSSETRSMQYSRQMFRPSSQSTSWQCYKTFSSSSLTLRQKKLAWLPLARLLRIVLLFECNAGAYNNEAPHRVSRNSMVILITTISIMTLSILYCYDVIFLLSCWVSLC